MYFSTDIYKVGKFCRCVLVIGATSGIGRALALSIRDLPHKPTLIVAGRRKERLEELVKLCDHDGDRRLETVQFDQNAARDTLIASVQDILEKYPNIDAVVLAAGIQCYYNFFKPDEIDLDKLTEEFNTNYVSILTMLFKCFIPHFLRLSEQGRHSLIIPIGSGLGVTPASSLPTYSATKAALHSLSLSLQKSLQGTSVHVMEILPPLVESELHDYDPNMREHLSKFWMPLDEFTKIEMDGLQKGEPQIAAGWAAEQLELFEKGKIDHVR
ncbi:NAD-P-binding protein [Artomyces pyxidatus]|uniref:NAD-P-binding protein n=1 Tax=Artomyces pyxidatus TaxID=48021 RepID=A0ACB8TH05_9AGAM|nr:NAD-P-binding protein [Artomyces pyxidatus]